MWIYRKNNKRMGKREKESLYSYVCALLWLCGVMELIQKAAADKKSKKYFYYSSHIYTLDEEATLCTGCVW